MNHAFGIQIKSGCSYSTPARTEGDFIASRLQLLYSCGFSHSQADTARYLQVFVCCHYNGICLNDCQVIALY